MSTSYGHFTASEREKLLVFVDRGLSFREMGRRLGRSASSVSRELKRNSGRGGRYSPSKAQEKYQERRRSCVRKRIFDNAEVRESVAKELLDFWSPEQISGRQKATKAKVCVSYPTIYRAIREGELEVPKKCLRRKGHRPSPHTEETRGRLHGQKTIQQRPKGADTRSQYGHWEGDTVLGSRGKGAAATFVDRRSGYLIAARMPNRKAETLNAYCCKAFEGIQLFFVLCHCLISFRDLLAFYLLIGYTLGREGATVFPPPQPVHSSVFAAPCFSFPGLIVIVIRSARSG